jgi:hypothetical protein
MARSWHQAATGAAGHGAGSFLGLVWMLSGVPMVLVALLDLGLIHKKRRINESRAGMLHTSQFC